MGDRPPLAESKL